MFRETPVLGLLALMLVVSLTSACTAQTGEVGDLEAEVAALKEEVALLRKELDEVLALAPIQSLIVENRPINVMMDIAEAQAMGKPKADLTLVEFSDFQCPYCARHVAQTYPAIKDEFVATGKVKYVFMDFPLGNHPLAPKASEAALCAGEQNRFWEMHDELFSNQRALQPENLPGYASAVGVADLEAFQECLDSDRYKETVAANMQQGTKLRVRGTPTFGLGYTSEDGESVHIVKVLRGAQPLAQFQAAINELLESDPPVAPVEGTN